MSKKKKILIIDNQQYEFKNIVEFLKDKYETFPSEVKFVVFMNNVHVIINNNYSNEYIEQAKKYLFTFIKEKKIDLILMDHILGSYHCDTGIELARKIYNPDNNMPNIPIVFFSKTNSTNHKLLKDYDSFKEEFSAVKSEWAPKGYFGYEHLDPEYFQSKVIDKIDSCLGESRVDKLIKHIKNVIYPECYLDNGNPPTDKTAKKEYDMFEQIVREKLFSLELANYIYAIKKRSMVDVEKLKELIKKISNNG
jgi:CheY-like chemotaxis protein